MELVHLLRPKLESPLALKLASEKFRRNQAVPKADAADAAEKYLDALLVFSNDKRDFMSVEKLSFVYALCKEVLQTVLISPTALNAVLFPISCLHPLCVKPARGDVSSNAILARDQVLRKLAKGNVSDSASLNIQLLIAVRPMTGAVDAECEKFR